MSNQMLMVLTTILSEIMNDCRDGKLIVDIYALFSTGWKTALLKYWWHSLYASPMIGFWNLVGIVGTIIPGLQFYGGYGIGQVLRRLVIGN